MYYFIVGKMFYSGGDIEVDHFDQFNVSVSEKHDTGFFLIVPGIETALTPGFRIYRAGNAVVQPVVKVDTRIRVGDDKFDRRPFHDTYFFRTQPVVVLN